MHRSKWILVLKTRYFRHFSVSNNGLSSVIAEILISHNKCRFLPDFMYVHVNISIKLFTYILITCINPLSANFIKWSNILKQFVGKLPRNCLSVFDQFVGLALKGLTSLTLLLSIFNHRCVTQLSTISVYHLLLPFRNTSLCMLKGHFTWNINTFIHKYVMKSAL